MQRPPKRKVVRIVDLDRACIIREGDEEYCIYPLDDVLAVLGKKWALFVIAVLGNERRTRFSELLRALRGISPRTLTDRLRELENLRLVERLAVPDVSRRVEYALTEEGWRMRAALIPFLKWSLEFEATGMPRPSRP